MNEPQRTYTHSDDPDGNDKLFGVKAQKAVAELYQREGYEVEWNDEQHIKRTGCQINVEGREIMVIARNVYDKHESLYEGITVSKDLYFRNGGWKRAALFEDRASIVCFVVRQPDTGNVAVIRCSYPVLKAKLLSRWDKCDKLRPTEGGYAYNKPSKAAVETNTYRYKYPFKGSGECKRGVVPLYLSDLLSVAIDTQGLSV